MTNEFEVNILLLVEDSDDDVIITQRKLFKSELKIHEFLVAKTLSEGLHIIKEKTVDVVLLDLNLPETKGIDTLIAFRRQYDGIIIVCTSLEDEMIGVQAIRKGADDYLVKSSMSESSIARSILYARERRNMRHHLALVKEKVAQLEQFTGG